MKSCRPHCLSLLSFLSLLYPKKSLLHIKNFVNLTIILTFAHLENNNLISNTISFHENIITTHYAQRRFCSCNNVHRHD